MTGINQNFGGGIGRHVDKGALIEALLKTDRTEQDLFNTILKQYAADVPICGEKTPAHIHEVPLLLNWFPKAKIIHAVRDPRAIYISSMLKRKKRSPRNQFDRFIYASPLLFNFYQMMMNC